MIELQQQGWPERLKKAMHDKKQLAVAGIHFAPIRHHSPACAHALQHLIQQLQPTHILVEAPSACQFLIPSLQHPDTRPPIALFAQAKVASDRQGNAEDTQLHSAYFPFCDYSPEWIAIQQAKSVQAELQFIDLPWSVQSQFSLDNQQHQQKHAQLMSERYLAHSQYIQQLAERLHCRDHDELWDHLFELQAPAQLKQPDAFFDDVFAWCALARLDYEHDVLLHDGSLQREHYMWEKIQALLNSKHENQRILVLTGGFHTLALIEQLTLGQGLLYDQTQLKPTPAHQQHQQEQQDQAWLIRYSFDRLDALNGYASGMPSPAFYQQFWLDLNQPASNDTLQSTSQTEHAPADIQQLSLDYLSQLCHDLNDKSCLDINTFLAIQQSAELAWRLAQLRGHYRPSRYDLLDALQSALIKGEIEDGQQQLNLNIHLFLSGQSLGQVPADQLRPALVNHVIEKVEKFRFNLSDTLHKQRKLDVYRKPRHQEISQFLHLLDFVACGFASHLSGPDFVHGTSMDLLFEEWRYAWTPQVEARLIELAEHGEQLEHIALHKLNQQLQQALEQGLGQSAAETARLLAQACRLGLKKQLIQLQQQLFDRLEQDQNLASIISAAQQLYYLWHGRNLLQLPAQALLDISAKALKHACYLLDQLYDTHEDKVEENLKQLKNLHQLIISNQHLPETEHVTGMLDLFYQNIDRTRLQQFNLSKLLGAFDALNYLDQRINQSQLQQYIQRCFDAGTEIEQAVAYLHGLLCIAPDVFVQSHVAIDTLYQRLSLCSDTDFIQILPDLRFLFSQLSPKQSSAVSARIAQLSGLSENVVLDQVLTHLSETELLEGVTLNQQLQQCLVQDQLLQWIVEETQRSPATQHVKKD